MAIPCPDCGRPLPAQAPSCPACGVRLVGPDAQRLWQVDQQLATLSRERTALLTQLRAPAPAPEARMTAAGRPPHRARSWTVQQLLLTGGVVLLFVAAVVFIAVAWRRIGTGGQVAVLAVVTASGIAGARALARRGLLASAEAVAVLTVGLALLDAFAVRRYGLLSSDRLEPPTYWLLGLPAVALVLLGGARAARRSLAFPVAVTLVAAAWPGALVGSLGVEVAGVAVVAAGAWVVGLAAALALSRSVRRPVLVAVAAVAAGWLLLGAQASVVAVATDRPTVGLPALGAAAVLVAGLVVAARRTAAVPHAAAVIAAYALSVLVVVAETHHAGPWGLAALSAAASLVVGAVVATGSASRLTSGAPTALVGLAWLAGLVSVTEADASWWATGTWLAVTSVSAAVASRAVHGAARPALWGYTAVTGALAVAAFAHAGSDAVRVAVTTAAAVLLAAAAATRRERREEPGLGVGAAVGTAVAAGYALAADQRPLLLLAIALGVVGATALLYGALPHRGLVAVLGVALCSAATWSLDVEADVRTVEAYSVPLAVLALGAGLVRRYRHPRAPSWTTVGPGLAAGLLPSALASVPDAGLVRPVLTLAAAVAVTAVGVRLHEQGPVVTGVVASVVVALAQAGPYAVALPRWLSLGLAGALLLAMGFRYEQRRRDAIAAAHWLAGLR
ncbi:MAG: SCO7613 C-terminal domain-containing membrane protein [Angustibacter sp.]